MFVCGIKMSVNDIEIFMTGNVTSDVDMNRIRAFIEFQIQSMIGRKKSDNTKPVSIQVTIREG